MTASLAAHADAQLKNPGNQADYIVIVPTEFKQAMEPYCAWRRAQHMNVRLVELRQIDQEFKDDTLTSSGRIRAFVSYALQYWASPKPKYLLLAGDAQFIPSVRLRSEFAGDPEHKEDSVSIDEWYAVNSYEADKKPDLAIGRFPARTVAQLQVMTSKTKQFEESLIRHNYANDILFITDRVDAADFESSVDFIMATTIPSYYRTCLLRFGDTTSSGGTRRKLFDAMNASTFFLCTFIHGNPKTWSQYGYFTSSDIDSLRANHRPFILTSGSCWQNFDVPTDSVIVEKLLAMPNGGAVATFASTGLSWSWDESYLLNEFYTTVFTGRYDRIGDIILSVKRNSPLFWWGRDSSSTNESYFAMRRQTLLGDPALRLPKDVATTERPKENVPPAAWALMQNFPNPFNSSTTISFSLPSQAFVTLKIYDAIGREVATIVSEELPAGTYTHQWNASGMTSGVYLYRLQAGSYTETKRLVLLK